MGDSFLTAEGENVARGGGVAVWRQIEEALVADIVRGAYPADSPFPTERELSERFDVNRHTVRRAVAGLVARGLLLVEQGRGSFVVRDAIEYTLGPRTRFTENLLRQGREPASELLGAEEEPASEEVARALKIRPGTRVVRLDTLGRANERAISLGRHYFPARRVPGLIELYRRWRSITKALREIGVEDYQRTTTRVTARLPTADESRLLRLAVTQPLLITESVNVERGGRPIEYGLAFFASDRVQLVVGPT